MTTTNPASRPATIGGYDVRVYGLNLLLEMRKDDSPVQVEVHCPKGHTIHYGQVLAHGDGFDPDARAFRNMAPVGSIVAFEELSEDIEGHYFFAAGKEYRVLHQDAVTATFTPKQ